MMQNLYRTADNREKRGGWCSHEYELLLLLLSLVFVLYKGLTGVKKGSLETQDQGQD